jgi:hypothetical protein
MSSKSASFEAESQNSDGLNLTEPVAELLIVNRPIIKEISSIPEHSYWQPEVILGYSGRALNGLINDLKLIGDTEYQTVVIFLRHSAVSTRLRFLDAVPYQGDIQIQVANQVGR